jgi:hypothetical protein
MRVTFKNDFHHTTAVVTARDWRLSRQQVVNIFMKLCGDMTCPCTDWNDWGICGPNKYRLKKLSDNSAEVICQN